MQETQQLMQQGYSRNLGSMKGLGYRQFSGYLAGEYSYDEAVRLLKRDTRHFAKRQMTWFRRMEKQGTAIRWIDGLLDMEAKVNIIIEHSKAKPR